MCVYTGEGEPPQNVYTEKSARPPPPHTVLSDIVLLPQLWWTFWTHLFPPPPSPSRPLPPPLPPPSPPLPSHPFPLLLFLPFPFPVPLSSPTSSSPPSPLPPLSSACTHENASTCSSCNQAIESLIDAFTNSVHSYLLGDTLMQDPPQHHRKLQASGFSSTNMLKGFSKVG